METLVSDEFDDDEELSWEEQQEFEKIIKKNFCGTPELRRSKPFLGPDIYGNGGIVSDCNWNPAPTFTPWEEPKTTFIPGGWPSYGQWSDGIDWGETYVVPSVFVDTHFSNSSEGDIIAECDALKALLLEKNRKYGDSALNPTRIFSRADAVEQIKVRIDDKLTRLKNAQDDEDEDVVQDLMGYLVLLRIAMKRSTTTSSLVDALTTNSDTLSDNE